MIPAAAAAAVIAIVVGASLLAGARSPHGGSGATRPAGVAAEEGGAQGRGLPAQRGARDHAGRTGRVRGRLPVRAIGPRRERSTSTCVAPWASAVR